MQRANNFNLHLPARMLFKTQQKGECRFLGGLVPLQDFQVMSEKPSEAAKRIYMSTGLQVAHQPDEPSAFMTKEPISDS